MSLLSILALLAPAPALAVKEAPKNPPKFKPRWYFSHNRLDARPVIWSLENHPEEWQVDVPGLSILHKPSKHTFWIGESGPARLFPTECSCHTTSRLFQPLQEGAFRRAYTSWVSRGIRAQFASHFTQPTAPYPE